MGLLDWRKQPGRDSFTRCGEDLIIDFALSHVLHVEQPSYVDIGARDPVCF